jgi:uncharacterized membrane protein
MHGFGFNGQWMMPDSFGIGSDGWMVMAMMGLGFLLIVGLGAWLLYEQRDKLAGISGNAVAGMSRPHMGADSAEDIARGRYARGEIDQARFEDIIATLRHK